VKFPCARIDGDALRHNLAVVRRFAPGSRVLAVIKANAYGHGLIPVARTLRGADALGVARLEEGVTLREAGIESDIVLLEGIFSGEQLTLAQRHRFELVVHSAEQIAILENHAGAASFTVWLKLDTGMNRLGVRVQDVAAALSRLRGCRVVTRLRLMTHLAVAEEETNAATPQQIAAFASATDGIVAERSIANSAGLILWPQARTDWVRPGLMLYGISPIAGREAAALGLRPAMTLTTQVIAMRRVPAGETVGYGGIWRAARDSTIGIAAIGYGDGYPRRMRGGTPVLVDGHVVPVVGRVSMDMTAVDLTDHPTARVGNAVTLWGEGLPAECVAPYADTIPYELVCGVSQRVALDWHA
jgi:alanine racemase